MPSGQKVCMFFGAMWPSTVGVRVQGDQGTKDDEESSAAEESSANVNHDKFLESAKSGSLQKINKILFRPDLNVNYVADNFNHETALYQACDKGHLNVVERLLRHSVRSYTISLLQF